MGHLRTSFKHSPDTVFWLDAAWDLMEKKAWEVSEEKAARLRYYIALDLFEYAPKDGITEVSGLIREHLSELSELKKLYVSHGPLFRAQFFADFLNEFSNNTTMFVKLSRDVFRSL